MNSRHAMLGDAKETTRKTLPSLDQLVGIVIVSVNINHHQKTFPDSLKGRQPSRSIALFPNYTMSSGDFLQVMLINAILIR